MEHHAAARAGREPRISRRAPVTLTAAERERIAAFVMASIPYPRDRFDRTIDKADYLWLAYDEAGTLVGTSAVRTLPAHAEGRAVTLLYTAMVVIAPAYRRHGLIARFGMRTYLRERALAPLRGVYWLSLAASPSGFSQMAHNFAAAWPRRDQPMPPLVRDLFGQAFAILGLDEVEEVEGCFRVRDTFGVADETQAPHLWDRKNPHVDFFLRVNPDYQRGADIACLCPLDIVSLSVAIARQLQRNRRARGARTNAVEHGVRAG